MKRKYDQNRRKRQSNERSDQGKHKKPPEPCIERSREIQERPRRLSVGDIRHLQLPSAGYLSQTP